MNTTTTAENNRVLYVNHWLTKFIGLLAAIMFTFFIIVAFDATKPLYLLALVGFAGLGIFVFLLYGKTGMDSCTIIHVSTFGRFEIKWEEIQAIELDAQGNAIVFKGDNKQLVVPGQVFWSGKDKKQMVALYNAQIDRRNIKVRATASAAFALSKNTRVN